jgi:hypothetical protein
MLGYKRTFSASERLTHHELLKEKRPELLDELEYLYLWVSDDDFWAAYLIDSPNQYQWLKSAMEHPPIELINHLIIKARSKIELCNVKLKRKPRPIPKCFACEKQLATTISTTIKFSVVMCGCSPKACHTVCADSFMSKHSQCFRCRKYFKMKNHFSSLRSILLPPLCREHGLS